MHNFDLAHGPHGTRTRSGQPVWVRKSTWWVVRGARKYDHVNDILGVQQRIVPAVMQQPRGIMRPDGAREPKEPRENAREEGVIASQIVRSGHPGLILGGGALLISARGSFFPFSVFPFPVNLHRVCVKISTRSGRTGLSGWFAHL